MQERAGEQAPPLALFCHRPEVRAPAQVDGGIGFEQPCAVDEHRQKNNDIGYDDSLRHPSLGRRHKQALREQTLVRRERLLLRGVRLVFAEHPQTGSPSSRAESGLHRSPLAPPIEGGATMPKCR